MTHTSRSRRRVLRWLGSLLTGVGAGRGVAGPGGAPAGSRPGGVEAAVEVSLAGVEPGEMVEVQWQGRPVFVRRRTADEIARERAVPMTELRDPERDQARVLRPEWVVVEGICTHGGCIPEGPLGDYGGWYCLCHGSQFDTAGRVRAGPARENLKVPPHEFVGDALLRVGPEGGGGKAS